MECKIVDSKKQDVCSISKTSKIEVRDDVRCVIGEMCRRDDGTRSSIYAVCSQIEIFSSRYRRTWYTAIESSIVLIVTTKVSRCSL